MMGIIQKREEEKVKCPNCCYNDKVQLSDSERALYKLVDCEVCKGKGYVLSKNLSRILERYGL